MSILHNLFCPFLYCNAAYMLPSFRKLVPDTIVGAKFIAPPVLSDSVSSVRIGWESGRNEFGPYNAQHSQRNWLKSIMDPYNRSATSDQFFKSIMQSVKHS